MSEIMKIIERETQKKKQRQKRTRGTKAILKGWELNDFEIREKCFYATFGFLRFKVASKRTMNLLKGSKDVLCDPCVGPLPLFF